MFLAAVLRKEFLDWPRDADRLLNCPNTDDNGTMNEYFAFQKRLNSKVDPQNLKIYFCHSRQKVMALICGPSDGAFTKNNHTLTKLLMVPSSEGCLENRLTAV